MYFAILPLMAIRPRSMSGRIAKYISASPHAASNVLSGTKKCAKRRSCA
jgi:hypothetical protein